MRPAPLAPCACEHCSPHTAFLDRAALWVSVLGFVLIPGRVLLHFVGFQ